VSPDRWIALGVVARPHGVRGEVRIHLYNAASDVVLALREIDLEGHGRFRVAAARRDREAVLLRLEGCSTRDRADELRGARIGVPRSALPAPDDGEFYLCDLVGLEATDPTGAALGRVVDVREGPGHATLVLEAGGKTLEVPLAEPFVRDLDVGDGRLVLEGIDELRESLRE